MLKSQVRGSDEDGGIALSGIIVVAIVAIAMVGVLAGLWKIDILGLVAICAGAFIMVLFFPNPWAFIPGIVLIVLGLMLWFDVIGIQSPFSPGASPPQDATPLASLDITALIKGVLN